MANKKLLFVAAAALLLAAGCGKQASNNPPGAQTGNQQTMMKGEGSFKDFLAGGKSQKCEASFKSGDTTSSGTMYVASGKMRGDFSAQVQGKTMQSHMIVKDQTVYSWTEGLGLNAAFKTALNTSNTNSSQSRSVDVNQKVSYACQSWTEDDSQFALPIGMTFSDTAAMMPGGAAGNPGSSQGSDAKNQQCLACNSAGSAKTQCLAALGCK